VTAENLLLITIDALRRDAVGCLGSNYASTPQLDALAARGALFDQAISNGPRTQSSFPSVMCSLHPLAAGERRALPAEATTLAEAASAAGLATSGFNPSNPFLTRESGYHRGFEHFIDFWDVHERSGSDLPSDFPAAVKRRIHDAIGRRSLGFLMLLQALLLEEGGQYLTGRMITDRALDWLGTRRRPFFAWLHFMDVHYPYQPLPGTRTRRDRLAYVGGLAGLLTGRPHAAIRSLTRLYGRRVELVDRFIGDLVSGLERLDLDGTTIVAVTSDHGEQLGEHRRWAHGPDLHEELIRVPLILAGPGVDRGRMATEQVELLGLAPTLLELLGIPAPASFLGSSFAHLAAGGRGAGAEIVFSEAMHSGGRKSRAGVIDTETVTSCRTGVWKLIHDTEGDTVELFNLDDDPGETADLSAGRPDRVGDLEPLIAGHRRRTDALADRLTERQGPGSDPDDDAIRRRLASLGYL
jgi:arylsulfatase A-like enzyme